MLAAGSGLQALKPFLSMQVPLMGATSSLRKRCKSAVVGNVIFWTTFCVLGQPICIMMYYYAWVLENRPDWLPPDKQAT